MYIYNKVCLSDVLFSPAGVSASVACWSVWVYLDEERVVVAVRLDVYEVEEVS